MASPQTSVNEPKLSDGSDIEKKAVDGNAAYQAHTGDGDLKRQLKNRHAQMISIGEHVRILE